jgi:hypothetical protein
MFEVGHRPWLMRRAGRSRSQAVPLLEGGFFRIRSVREPRPDEPVTTRPAIEARTQLTNKGGEAPGPFRLYGAFLVGAPSGEDLTRVGMNSERS